MNEIIANDALVGAVIAAVGGVIAAGVGIGAIGAAAMKAISKSETDQNKSDIRDNMLLSCAMIEGVALFAVIIGYMMYNGGLGLLKGTISG